MQGTFIIFHVNGKALLFAREQKTETLKKKKKKRILVQKKIVSVSS